MINKVKVKNMVSERGNDIPNQFEISTPKGLYFQSYNTIIAFIDNTGQIWLDEDKWDYSVTTGKYRNLFLGEKKPETVKKLLKGIYKTTNLN
tara:strand:- start:371 stop:646 length:276 start_codon:yes stop_codon:yes gene_type:complete